MPKKYKGDEERAEKTSLGKLVQAPKFQRENWMLRKPFGKALIHRELAAGDIPFRPGNPDPPHRLRRKFKYDPSKEGQN